MIDLSRLNTEQKEAVSATEGPTLVLAGAGTGKTTVITHRIALLLSRRVRPGSILGITFTNKAAAEMAVRVKDLIGKNRREWPLLCTFHAFCLRVLRKHISKLGYKNRFSIYDMADQAALMRSIIRDMTPPGSGPSPTNLLARLSVSRNTGKPIDDDCESLISVAAERYAEGLFVRNAVDFDDMLSLTLRLFREHPRVLNQYQKTYKYVLVDEYQDTNSVQYELVRLLVGKHMNLCAVGDDDQSIYGWRGADYRNVLSFEKDFPGATTVTLGRNYRSHQIILDAANAVIANNIDRKPKTLRTRRTKADDISVVSAGDEADEAEWIARNISEGALKRKFRPGQCAILFRANSQAAMLEQCLRTHKIGYTLVGASSFFDRREIRDLSAYLKLLVNPRDEVAMLRIINFPQRGIGPSSVRALLETSKKNNENLSDTIRKPESVHLAPREAGFVQDFTRMMNSLRKGVHQEKPSVVLRNLVERISYRAAVDHLYGKVGHAEQRWELVEELCGAAEAYEKTTSSPSCVEFLQSITLDAESGEDAVEQTDTRNVTLMTVHRAKGLEFDRVYVYGLNEGMFPHKKSMEDGADSLEEERRLFYVAVTRAKKSLTLTYAKRQTTYGKTYEGVPSRFLSEIPEELTKYAEWDSEAPASPETAQFYIKQMKETLGVAPAPPTSQ